MLFETAEGRRRLYRIGDPYHPDREGSKTIPDTEDLPAGYAELLKWYREWCEAAQRNRAETDPLLQARGSGKHIWADEHADEYVNRLRDGWE
jgi:hypothetical protein